MTSKPKLKPHQRLIEFPNEGFIVLDGNMYCNYCDCNVSWVHKSDVAKHIQRDKHDKGKKRQISMESESVSGDNISENPHGEGTSTRCLGKNTHTNSIKRQRSMGEMVSASQKKAELIGDLITIFAVADIPLQKVDAIRPFLRKHVNNGGSIPSSSYQTRLFKQTVNGRRNNSCAAFSCLEW